MNTSKLQMRTSEYLSVHFGEYTIRENYRPYWLLSEVDGRLELDFYIEELKTGIEVQGTQHFKFTPHFHRDETGFERRLYLDKLKRELCESNGVTLIEVSDEADVINLINIKPVAISAPFVPSKLAETFIDHRRQEREERQHNHGVKMFLSKWNRVMAEKKKQPNNPTLGRAIELLRERAARLNIPIKD